MVGEGLSMLRGIAVTEKAETFFPPLEGSYFKE